MECAGTVTLFKKGYIRIQFWHCGGRVRSTLNTGTSPTERTADTSITWSRLLSFCWKARFLPWIAIKSLTPSPRTEKHLACRKASLSDLSHSMPHDCVIDFWESRLLDPVERERITGRNRNLHQTAVTDVFPCGIFAMAVRALVEKQIGRAHV